MTADVTGGDGGAGWGYRICWKWPQSPGTKAFADSSAQGQDGYGSFISVQTSATPPVSEQEAPAAPVHSSEASPPSCCPCAQLRGFSSLLGLQAGGRGRRAAGLLGWRGLREKREGKCKLQQVQFLSLGMQWKHPIGLRKKTQKAE